MYFSTYFQNLTSSVLPDVIDNVTIWLFIKFCLCIFDNSILLSAFWDNHCQDVHVLNNIYGNKFVSKVLSNETKTLIDFC